MAQRPTIADLAKASGVSVATVDRVLNSRLPVREETARRVFEAATEIGFHATGLIHQRIRQDLPEYRLGFLLQKPEQHFYRDFAAHLRSAVSEAPRFRGVASIDFWAEQSPDEIVARLDRMAERCRAVALVSPDHPQVTAAIEALKARGVPVFALLSDFAFGVREGYIGLNNRKAGRTAAWMIHRCARTSGKVAVFVGSHRMHGQEMRETGLRSYFRENAPDFTVMETLFNLETGDTTHRALAKILREHRDLVGCYVAGGGMEGAISAMREAGRVDRPIMICNEITPESRAALADEIVTMVIATPLQRLCRDLVELMGHTIRNGAANAPGQTFLPFDVYFPESA